MADKDSYRITDLYDLRRWIAEHYELLTRGTFDESFTAGAKAVLDALDKAITNETYPV